MLIRGKILWAILLLIAGCSYSLRRGDRPLVKLGGGTAPSSGIQRIYIPMVENITTQVASEDVLTEALREVFSTQPGLEIVNSEKNANFILLGRVQEYGTKFFSPTSPSSANSESLGGLVEGQVTAADIKVFMTADFELLENVSETLRRSLWSKSLRGEASFEAYNRFDEASGATSAPHINRSRSLLQLRKVSKVMAQKILDQVSQDF